MTTKAQRINARQDKIFTYYGQTKSYWENYEIRVTALENQGLTRSDAQGVIDAEDMHHE